MFINAGDGVYTHGGRSLKYRYKPSQTDRRNILVIFSGFRDKGTLDFSGNSLNCVRQDIVWIYDEFGENNANSYYLRHDGESWPEDIVVSFIDNLCSEFNIKRDMIIAAGFSKGGSAALYFSLKLGLGGTVVTVPQLFMGTYL